MQAPIIPGPTKLDFFVMEVTMMVIMAGSSSLGTLRFWLITVIMYFPWPS